MDGKRGETWSWIAKMWQSQFFCPKRFCLKVQHEVSCSLILIDFEQDLRNDVEAVVRYDSPTHRHSGFDLQGYVVLLSSIIPHWIAFRWCHRSCQVCPILMLRAAPNMFADQVQLFFGAKINAKINPSNRQQSIHPSLKIQAKNPNTLRAKKWYGEYCVSRSQVWADFHFHFAFHGGSKVEPI